MYKSKIEKISLLSKNNRKIVFLGQKTPFSTPKMTIFTQYFGFLRVNMGKNGPKWPPNSMGKPIQLQKTPSHKQKTVKTEFVRISNIKLGHAPVFWLTNHSSDQQYSYTYT